MEPPRPANEIERLRNLRLYRILDTASEQSFDELTQLASSICGCPISLITLVDENRQWFKSRVGMKVKETSRTVAFCSHAILQDDLFVVENALEDERFAQNPLVTSDPSIRFYAGAPLTVSTGLNLGTLCVIDVKPRQLSDDQLEALGVLRRSVVTQLELRRALEDLRLMGQLLSMCAWCRSIKSSDGTWQSLDQYVNNTSHVTHGVCPTCADRLRESGKI